MIIARLTIVARIFTCLSLFTAVTCAAAVDVGTGAASPTLYEALGGEKIVSRIAEELIDNTTADPRTKRSFDKVNLTKLKKKLVEHLCAIADGPCKYTGDTMAQSHKGLNITEAEFYLMVQKLRDTLDGLGVSESAKNELLKRLAPMKRDIVSQ